MAADDLKSLAVRFGASAPGLNNLPTNLAPGARAGKTALCAVILEDSPVGADSRLEFESFDQGLSEGYSVANYKEHGATRAAQPGYLTYQGGDWQPFQLKLFFQAGMNTANATALSTNTPNEQAPPDIENLLIEMESKVRWLQALTFPLSRSGGALGERVLSRARTFGVRPTAAATTAAANLKRNDPPWVLVVFGSWMVIRGYVMTVDIKWQPPFHPVSARPYGAEVDLSIKPNLLEYPTWQLIRNRAGQGGLTTALAADRSSADAQAADIARANALGTPRPTTGIVTEQALAAGARTRETARDRANQSAIAAGGLTGGQ